MSGSVLIETPVSYGGLDSTHLSTFWNVNAVNVVAMPDADTNLTKSLFLGASKDVVVQASEDMKMMLGSSNVLRVHDDVDVASLVVSTDASTTTLSSAEKSLVLGTADNATYTVTVGSTTVSQSNDYQVLDTLMASGFRLKDNLHVEGSGVVEDSLSVGANVYVNSNVFAQHYNLFKYNDLDDPRDAVLTGYAFTINSNDQLELVKYTSFSNAAGLATEVKKRVAVFGTTKLRSTDGTDVSYAEFGNINMTLNGGDGGSGGNLGGGGSGGGGAALEPGSVTTAYLADNSVTSVKIVDGAVTTAELANKSVTSAKLGDAAVTTVALSNQSVTGVKLADGAVTGDKLAAGSITADKLAEGVLSGLTVTGTVGTGDITTDKLADDAVTSAKIADGAVLTASLSNLAVTSAKLADGSVTSLKLDTTTVGLWGVSSSNVYFSTSSNAGTGSVGVGTMTPEYKLDVNGDIHARKAVTSSSDARLKTNLVPVEGALDKVMRLTGYTYDRIGEEKRETGLIAQDVREVLPEAVHEDSRGMLSVAYGNMMSLVVQALKEMNDKIDATIGH